MTYIFGKIFIGKCKFEKWRWGTIKDTDVYTETDGRRSHRNLSDSDSFSVLMVCLFEKILDKNCWKLALLAPAYSVWSKKFNSSGIPQCSVLGFPSWRESCAWSWWQQKLSTALCQASVQKVACGCHRQKERKTAWIKIVFRHFWGCFAWRFKKFKAVIHIFIWKPSLQRGSQGLMIRGLSSTSSAHVCSEDSSTFLERQRAEIVYLSDCRHNFGTDRNGFYFSFPIWTIRGAVKKNSYFCFPCFNFLCVQRKNEMKRKSKDSVPNRKRKESWITRKINYQLMTVNIEIYVHP